MSCVTTCQASTPCKPSTSLKHSPSRPTSSSKPSSEPSSGASSRYSSSGHTSTNPSSKPCNPNPSPYNTVWAPTRTFLDGRHETKRAQIFMGGYLFTERALGRLCLAAYGFTMADFKVSRPIYCARRYLQTKAAIDGPTLYPANYLSKTSPRKVLQGWILPCRLAFVLPEQPRPALPLDADAEAYADVWFPRHLRESDAFKDVRYVERPWLYGQAAVAGVVERKMMLNYEETRREFQQYLNQWIETEKARGIENPVVPPQMPTLYTVD